jgi:hypothetical protein
MRSAISVPRRKADGARRLLSILPIAAFACVPFLGTSLTAASAAPRREVLLPRQSSAAPQGSIGVRLVDVPVASRDDPRARLYIIDHVAPGSVITRRIEVTNTAASPAHIVTYPASAKIAKGSFVGAAGHTQNDLSTWTTVQPGDSDVGPGERLQGTVQITVPKDAAPGEHYGVVWAETQSAPVDGGSVLYVNRVGIRIYLSVGAGGAPAADFTIDSLTAKRSPDGLPMVLASVHNTGGRALDMSGALNLRDGPGGLHAGPFPAQLGVTLAIGATESVTIALGKVLPAGPWDARITLHSGLLDRSANATITFPKRGSAAPVSTTATRTRWVYFAIVALVLLLLGLGILLRVSSRSRRHAP